MVAYAITTVDNPYDPFDQFDSWYMFDLDKGYNSCSYLDRVARTSDQLTPEENDQEIKRAIKEIIRYDYRDIYRMVTKEIDDPELSDGS